MSCDCGHSARFAGRRNKLFESVLGSLKLSRAYYHCAACGKGFCPRDHAMGLQDGSLTPGVLRMVGQVGARVSFAEGQELLADLAGVDLTTKHVERAAEALGREIAADEESEAEEPAETGQLAQTVYLGMDGTGVPMRASETAGRKGKQPDGSAKTREAKLVTVWTAENRDDNGMPVRDQGSITYSAAVESAATLDTDHSLSPFAQRVNREAQRRGFHHAERRVVLGDGALWIWNIAGNLFPGAIEVVDIFHAKENLGRVAKDIWGTGSDLGKHWAEQRCHELDRGQIDNIVDALQVHEHRSDEARKCIGYLLRNRKRMRYQWFRERGICVSTGVVESGCKVAIGNRLKTTGMHWTVDGANAIMALRCARLNMRFDKFWEGRTVKKPNSAA